MFMIGRLLGVLVHALHPGWWALFYQLPLAFGLAYIIARQHARPTVPRADILHLTAIAGVGGPLVCWFFMALWTNGVTALLGLVAMWVGTSFGVDKYLDVDWESSQRITGAICVPIWLAWLVIGGIFVAIH